MYTRPTTVNGASAIVRSSDLVREFLFEDRLDHLLEIGKYLGAQDSERLTEAVSSMTCEELRSWVTWLLQVDASEGARIIDAHILAGVSQ